MKPTLNLTTHMFSGPQLPDQHRAAPIQDNHTPLLVQEFKCSWTNPGGSQEAKTRRVEFGQVGALGPLGCGSSIQHHQFYVNYNGLKYFQEWRPALQCFATCCEHARELLQQELEKKREILKQHLLNQSLAVLLEG